MPQANHAANAGHELDAPPWRLQSTIMSTAKSIRRAYDRQFGEIGLNLSEASLLDYVVEYGPISQTQVAERIGMGRAPAGAIVDILTNHSLIQRNPDATDRRVWLLTATDKGRALAQRVAEVDKSLRTVMRAGSSQEERELLTEILTRIRINLSAILNTPTS